MIRASTRNFPLHNPGGRLIPIRCAGARNRAPLPRSPHYEHIHAIFKIQPVMKLATQRGNNVNQTECPSVVWRVVSKPRCVTMPRFKFAARNYSYGTN
jgi:hypothetical protein